jgi:hypothetical protein
MLNINTVIKKNTHSSCKKCYHCLPHCNLFTQIELQSRNVSQIRVVLNTKVSSLSGKASIHRSQSVVCLYYIDLQQQCHENPKFHGHLLADLINALWYALKIAIYGFQKWTSLWLSMAENCTSSENLPKGILINPVQWFRHWYYSTDRWSWPLWSLFKVHQFYQSFQ